MATKKVKIEDNSLVGGFTLPKSKEALAEIARKMFELGASWHAEDIGLDVKTPKLKAYLDIMLPLPKKPRIVFYAHDIKINNHDDPTGWYRWDIKKATLERAWYSINSWSDDKPYKDEKTAPASKAKWKTVHTIAMNMLTSSFVKFIDDLRTKPWAEEDGANAITLHIEAKADPLGIQFEKVMSSAESEEDEVLSQAEMYFALVKKHKNENLSYEHTDEAGVKMIDDAYVPSDSKKQNYHVFKFDDGSVYCECKAWAFDKNEHKCCKHIVGLGWDTFVEAKSEAPGMGGPGITEAI